MRAAILLVLTTALLAGCEKATVTGEGGTKLTLNKPSAVTLVRGGMAKTDVKITRKNVSGDVAVSFDKLPAGVEVVDGQQKIVGDSTTYSFKASDAADIVKNYAAQVTVIGPNGVSVTEPIEITVKEK